jgi:hypothetical protein
MFNKTGARRFDLVVKVTFRLLLAGFSLFVIWYEFNDIFESQLFIGLLMAWFVYAVMFFVSDWIDANKPTIEDKLDELIQEIRQDRDERKRKENYDG